MPDSAQPVATAGAKGAGSAADELTQGRASYNTGRERLANILAAAKQLFIEEGMAAFSMRRLAREVGISVGNLTYYYPNKDALLSDLMRYVIEPYLIRFAEFREAAGTNAEQQLRAVLEYVIEDLATYETTHFFPELWVLANRDEQAKAHMAALYAEYRGVMEEIIAAMRTDLPQQQIEDLALIIQCSIEGHTMFVGHDRTHRSRLPAVKARLVEHCIALVNGAEN
ncbi:MAG: TetR/AcrR family transcriptional regulator [Pseudomonadales bacterium]